MTEFWFQIPEEDEGERIDKLLSGLMESLSRSYLQKLLKDGLVFIAKPSGEHQAIKANYRVKGEERILVTVPEAVIPDIPPENVPLDILYEDKHLLVVNKPKGMVVHPAPGHYTGTLVNALMFHCQGSLSGINGVLRPGIVHRIDRDTTGALLVCKDDFTHQDIAGQLARHALERRYVGIVAGNLKTAAGTVTALLGRHPEQRKKMAVVAGGRDAVTHYQVLQYGEKHSYVECRLETGRTHQIRVHMSHIGHPLLGDEVYGGGKGVYTGKETIPLKGQVLHAQTLGFVHPITKEYLVLEAPLPAYFEHLLRVLP